MNAGFGGPWPGEPEGRASIGPASAINCAAYTGESEAHERK
jgi:hypothetical protein